MNHLHCVSLVTLVLSSACGGAEPFPEPSVVGIEPGGGNVVPLADDLIAAPSYVIELPGEDVRFFVDEYGSVGILGASRTGVSMLDHPDLDEAPPAVVFHALSEEVIPDEFLTLHADLVDQGEVAPLEALIAGRPAGWARPLGQAVSQPCRNSTFRERHCAHPSYDSSVCWLNISGARDTWVPYAHRFKAGYCLQDGSNWGNLYYQHVMNCGNHAHFPRNYVWGEQYTVYNATTYFTYVWWRPSTAPLRAFRHFSSYGGTRDFGSRYSQSACGS